MASDQADEWAAESLLKAARRGSGRCAEELVAVFGERLGERAFERALEGAREMGEAGMEAWLAGVQKAVLERRQIRVESAGVKASRRSKRSRSL